MFNRKAYASYANDTKWSELRQAMVKLYPRAPRFHVKTLNCPLREDAWDGEWHYHFKLDYQWKDMEWVDLKPESSSGAIQQEEIAAICRYIGLEIERRENIVRVIGFRQMS